eukprot:gene10435-11354_t
MKLLNRIFFFFCIFSVFYPLHLSLLTDGEIDAITAFYSNLGLDVSTLASDPCSWIGIGCAYNPSTTYDNVINITLSNYNLPGQLTNQILPNLQLLDLSQNQLRNRLLITSYSQLRILKLNNNRFTGFASSTINFQYLIYFDVSKNVITGPLPNIASNLPSLRTFNLSGNVFTGSIPDWNSMSSLSILDLSHNFISGTIPNWQNLPLLTRLQLNNNGLSGKVPDFMQLSHLVYLDVSRNQLTGMVAMPFSNLPNLHKPSSKPSMRPTTVPSSVPLLRPSVQPSSLPTSNPTNVPSAKPTYTPSSQPTNQPSSQPTLKRQPTARPSQQLISIPTSKPSSQPTQRPTVSKGGVKPANSSYSTSTVYGRVRGSIFLLGINLPLLYTSFILNISDFLSTPSTSSLLGNSYVIFGSSSQRSSFSLNQPSSFTEAYYTEIIPSITTSTTTLPSSSPSPTRHSFDSADVIKVNGSGRFYGRVNNATRFILDVNEMIALMDDGSAASSLVMVNLAVGRARERGVDVVKVVIEDFHNESDVIDLRRFGNGLYSIYSLEGVSYSVPPVVLLLSEWPVRMTVELRSMSSMSSLSGQNFLFSSASTEGSNEGGSNREVISSTVIIVVCVVVGFLFLSGSFYYWRYRIMKNEKNSKMQGNDVFKVQPDVVRIRNEIRVVNVDGKLEEKSVTVIPAIPNFVPLEGLDVLFDDDSMDFSPFPSLSELSDDEEALTEEEEEVLDDGWFE